MKILKKENYKKVSKKIINSQVWEIIKKLGKSGLLFFVIFLLSIILIIFLIQIFKLVIFTKVFSYVTRNIINVTGMSPWLAKGLVIFLLIPFVWAILEVTKLKTRLFKKGKLYRKLGIFIIVSYIGLFFLSMFFLSRSTYFGYTKGEVLKYYAITPEGIRFFDLPGRDPKWGIELKPVTPEIIEQYIRGKKGLKPKRINASKDTEFFDSITGESKVWYYKDSEGNYEFFDNHGFHPKYSVKLRPVTMEIIKDYERRRPRLALGRIEICSHVYGWRDYKIQPDSTFKKGDTYYIYSEALNINHDGLVNFDFIFKVYNPENNLIKKYKIPVYKKNRTSKDWPAWYFHKIPENWPSGRYKVEIEITDNVIQKTERGTAYFYVKEPIYKLKVIKEKANVRLSPDINSYIVAKVPYGAIFDIEEEIDEWYKISFEWGDQGILITGYIHKNSVRLIEQKDNY
ncbi:MAG: hypothetical protein ACE5KE_01685 [Methanosarcinales archaeon]